MFKTFQTKSEKELNHQFLSQGYVIRKVDKKKLDIVCDKIKKIILIKKLTKKKINSFSNQYLFNNFHNFINKKNLNTIRVKIISEINKNDEIKEMIYNLSKIYLNDIVGNELAIQKTLNLSIQLPKDYSSLLDMHSDAFSGESPFQVVLWIPLVDVKNTKSMFMLPINKSDSEIKKLKNYSTNGFDAIYKKNQKKLRWLKINYGEILIFSPNILHGNTVNKTNETRFSLNIRFKSLFSPYNKVEGNDRKLGYFYFPLNVKPATKIGLKFKYPKL
jgi:sporadic carbohydrate cluster 2OG-Fe(II) oxygenase